MAERSLFFDSSATDRRKYNSADWSKFMQIFYSTGIVSGGDFLRVIRAENALAVTVTPGCAIVEGRAYFLEGEALQLTVPAADPSYARLDRVVLRLDLSTDVRAVHVKVVAGIPGAAPSPPALVRNDNIYDLALAQFRVAPGALAVDAVTDERYDAELCGICQGLYTLDMSDFTDLKVFVAHIADDVRHITAEERADWNSKAPGDQGGAMVSDTAPTNKKAIWIDTAANAAMKYWNGTAWAKISSGAADTANAISDTNARILNGVLQYQSGGAWLNAKAVWG